MLRLTAVIARKDDIYVAPCPELEIVSEGNTIEAARLNLLEAAKDFFEIASSSEIRRRLNDD